MKWGIGVILVVIVGAAVWGLWPRKEHTPTPSQEITEQKTMQEIKIKSSAFGNNGMIPAKYTCDAGNPPAGGSPPLEISGVPEGTKSLALIMHDPDAPRAGGWTHWVRFNIPVNGNVEQVESYKVASFKLEEGKEPSGTAGKGTGGELTYQGPCPPSGTHRYFFSIYALNTTLSLKEGATKTEVERAMAGHIIGKGELVGLYSKKKI